MNLANYMTMALDPNIAHLANHMKTEYPSFETLLYDLNDELDMKLKSDNLTILELFHKVAVRYFQYETKIYPDFQFPISDSQVRGFYQPLRGSQRFFVLRRELSFQ